MKIHREGHRILLVTGATLFSITGLLYFIYKPASPFALVFSTGLLGFMLWFFRSPRRVIPEPDDKLLYSPADGRVVVIEEVEEPEYFGDKRLQVSIFMSITDVHLNRAPLSGEVVYRRYHPGRYLVAWHPKSSLENERCTTVIRHKNTDVLLRQIAGAVARRIRTYADKGAKVRQGEELGFIRFGSRVDILLPLDAEIEVLRGQQVYGNKTVIARLGG